MFINLNAIFSNSYRPKTAKPPSKSAPKKASPKKKKNAWESGSDLGRL